MSRSHVSSYIIDNTQLLYTAKEVADILKTNVDYVHKLRRSGLLPFMKIGQYKVRRESLVNFLRAFDGKDISDPFNIKELNGGQDERS